jgi:lipoprotein-anchoring transpeptidase ErfK/SrfK
MRTTKNQSRIAALATMLFMATISALAEEKLKIDAAANKTEEIVQVRKIIVSIQDRKLALLEGDKAVKIWDVAVGAESSPSPNGNYTIANRLRKPTYYHHGKVIKPGPSNPLGSRWLGLSIKGFGIHGTNAPKSIGKNASHGCIRMRNRDVEELFELVKAGDAVEIYGERNLYLAQIFQIDVQPAYFPVLSASTATSFSNN